MASLVKLQCSINEVDQWQIWAGSDVCQLGRLW